MNGSNEIMSILSSLRQQGGSITVNGSDLKIRAPQGVDSELKNSIRANKTDLIDFLNEQLPKDQIDSNTIPQQDDLCISYAQQRNWFLEQLYGANNANIQGGGLELYGELSVPALRSAFCTLVDRHQSLRMCFPSDNGEPTMAILPCYDPIQERDLSDVVDDEKNRRVKISFYDVFVENFNLSKGPLFRVQLIKVEEKKHLLFISMHHIISDAWSFGVLVRELMECYEAHRENRPDRLNALDINYSDYAAWQRNTLQGKILEEGMEFWLTQLKDAPDLVELPSDRPRPPRLSQDGGHLYQVINRDLYQELQHFSHVNGATLFMTLISAFGIFLSRHSGQNDICIGSPIANRTQPQTEELIGFFANTLVIRNRLEKDDDFITVLAATKETALGAFKHQHIPFEKLVEQLQPNRDLSYNPIFQVFFALQNAAVDTLSFSGLEIRPFDDECFREKRSTNFDLTLDVTEKGETLVCRWEYSSDLFDKTTIEGMSERFDIFLRRLLKSPTASVSTISLLTNEEEERLTQKKYSHIDYPRHKGLHQLLDAQASKTPDTTALVFNNQKVSYRELEMRTNRLAQYICQFHGSKKTAPAETIVGVCLNRSIDMIVAMIAVLKAGAAYMPLDPSYPHERLTYMVEDSGAFLLITQESLCGRLTTPNVEEIIIDSAKCKNAIETLGGEVPPKLQDWTPESLAYVIYTSGSTGRPKGVMVEHRAAVNFVTGFLATLPNDIQGPWLQLTTMTFDIALFEWMGSLSSGYTCVIANDREQRDPELLADLILRHDIGLAQTTPSRWGQLLDSGWLGKKSLYILCGGEALTEDLETRLTSISRGVFNCYGPTEATVWSLINKVDPAASVRERLSLGHGLPNYVHYVLDSSSEKELHLVPDGVVGELYIGGESLARGYLHRPELTSERFILNPFTDRENDHLYRTGDLVRRFGDDQLEYLGRADDQLKIRGFRVELGEIEQAIVLHHRVNKALVVARTDTINAGDKSLVAYLVAEGEYRESELIQDLHDSLNEKLPNYMLPSAFVILDCFPFTPNGKIDKKALPEPDYRDAHTRDYQAPKSELESALCVHWCDLLKLSRVGVTDNFFHIGGHSLLAAKAISHIRKMTGKSIPLTALFENPTIRSLVSLVELTSTSSAPRIKPCSSAAKDLSFAQQRLWFAEQLTPGGTQYIMPGAVRLSGNLNRDALQNSLSDIIERHQILRTVYAPGDKGQGAQEVHLATSESMAQIDLTDIDTDGQEEQLTAYLTEFSRKTFDLNRGPVLRSSLVRISPDEHIFVVSIHHIASDGWSMAIFVRELCEGYKIHIENSERGLSAPAVQYGDYAVWQRQYLSRERLSSHLDYWVTQLDGLPDFHRLPLDRPRPEIQDLTGNKLESVIPASLSQAIHTLAATQGVTIFMLFQAAFAILLSRYSNSDDVVIGVPTANREQEDIADVIGFFVNTLVVRSDLSSNPDINSFLENCRETLLSAYEHQQLPFELLVEKLCPDRNLSYSPLFQVALVFENNEPIDIALPGLKAETIEVDLSVAKYDLTLIVKEDDGKFFLQWEYAVALFDLETIEGIANSFSTLLSEIIVDPSRRVKEIPLISDSDTLVLNKFNNTRVNHPLERCIHQQFEMQAERFPEAPAVVFQSESLTYQELNSRANQLAHYLISEYGIVPDTLVGICLPRSVDMIVSMLAILKSGGAYLPLDPEYPDARLTHMIQDSQLRVVLTHQDILHRESSIPFDYLQTLCLDTELFEKYSIENPRISTLSSDHLAYVIYSSGSTGRPKGSLLPHKGLVNLGIAQRDRLYVSRKSRILQFASMSFDAATWEWVMALTNGASLWLTSMSVIQSAKALSKFVNENSLTHATLPPSLLTQLDPAECSDIETLIVAGESCSLDIAKQWSMGRRFINAYGPSEATVCACMGELSQDSKAVDIGKALPNTVLHVLDEYLNPVPINVEGELYIGGVGLARGYLDRKELTEKSFIPSPFGNEKETDLSVDSNFVRRLYKTGDRVRRLVNGNLVFVGRFDDQVKIRGFRVELGEIEAALAKQPEVKDVAVTTKGEMQHQRIIAYIVWSKSDRSANDGGADGLRDEQGIAYLRHALTNLLPEYMIPSSFVPLDVLPLNANGKIDKTVLPEPDVSAKKVGFIAPNTPEEKLLSQLWRDLLGVNHIGVEDNFFRLGGHSLLAMELVSMLGNYDMEVEVRHIFGATTLGELAKKIRQRKKNSGGDNAAIGVPENCHYITPEYLPLLDISQNEIDLIVKTVKGGVENIQDIYPLAPLQEGILFHCQLRDENAADAYVSSTLLMFDSPEIRQQFVQAIQDIVARHDILRTLFVWKDLSQPVQVVLRRATISVSWPTLDLSVSIRQQMDDLVAPGKQHLTLSDAPLMSILCADDDEKEEYFLALSFHHLIFDHIGLDVLASEARKIVSGESDSLGRPFQYRDFVAHTLGKSQEGDGIAYFSNMLGDVDEPTLPFSLSNVHGDGDRVSESRLLLDDAISHGIRQCAKQLGVGASAIFHAAWAWVIGVVSGRHDVVFGTVLVGRFNGEKDTSGALGLFVNTLPLRISTNNSAKKIVLNAHQALSELIEYDFCTLSDAQQASGVSGALPLFSGLLNYRHSGELERDATLGMTFLSGQERTNYPFVMSVDDLGAKFSIEAQVDESICPSRIVQYYKNALECIVDEAANLRHETLTRLDFLPEIEKRELLRQRNVAEIDYPSEVLLHQVFSIQAERSSAKTALTFGNQYLTYGELESKTNQLAHYLIAEHNIVPGSLVGISLERSLDMIVAMIAVLKAGAAYVPLDPSYPTDRLKYMVDDSGTHLIITQMTLAGRLLAPSLSEMLINTNETRLAVSIFPDRSPPNVEGLSGDDLAYVIYTSGSTGQPKGVMIEHRSALNFVVGFLDSLPDNLHGKWLLLTTITFDIALFEWMGCLASGYECVIASEEQQGDPVQLADLIDQQDIRVAQTTPTRWRQLIDGGWQGKKDLLILCGGEALTTDLQIQLSDRCRQLFNCYGPTEASVWSMVNSVDTGGPETKRLCLGYGLPNYQHYVLDEWQRLSPANVPGELYIGGRGLARGYLNRAQLTKERFVSNPFWDGEPDDPNARLYRTGDLVRWLEQGTLEYLGRIDDQIKIRGFRIEMGEIENALLKQDKVRKVVVVSDTHLGVTRIIAYCVLANNPRGDLGASSSIREAVAEVLPEYMVPQMVMVVDEFPLTSNGKIDKKSLPKPSQETVIGSYTAPVTELERALVSIWSRVLDIAIDKISTAVSFFDLGGHSILTMKVVSEAKRIGIDISAKDLFECRNIQRLSERCLKRSLRENSSARLTVCNATETLENAYIVDSPDDSITFPLTPAKAKFFSQHRDVPSHWNSSKLIPIPSKYDWDTIRESLEYLIQRHDALRSFFHLSGGNWQQAISTKTDAERIIRRDFSGVSEKNTHDQILRESQELQSTLDISKNLVRFCFFETGEKNTHYLAIVIHHLIIDAYSLNLFLKELEIVADRISIKEPIMLSNIETSIQDWAMAAKGYAEKDCILSELEYWRHLPIDKVKPLPVDFPENKNYNGINKCHSECYTLSKYETEILMEKIPQKLGYIHIIDLLNTAVLHVVSQWSGHNTHIIEQIRHGRDDFIGGVDYSNTIDFSLRTFPAVFTLKDYEVSLENIISVGDTLRGIPNLGAGFGLLKYMNKNPAVSAVMGGYPRSEIELNYLGDLDGESEISQIEIIGNDNSVKNHEDSFLECGAFVLDGELNVFCRSRLAIHKENTIRQLCQDFVRCLKEMTVL